MLPFEPIDLSGSERRAGRGTIGAVFATNLSGLGVWRPVPLAIISLVFGRSTGAARRSKSGGRVLKNVTGYDLLGWPGWGTLAILTEVTFKVVPKPERTATLVLFGLTDELASR